MATILQMKQRTVYPKDIYSTYLQDSVEWSNDGIWKTMYEGYPLLPPNDPPINGMQWYVKQKIGVWVFNPNCIVSNEPMQRGWNPFVRKSSFPAYEPLNVPDATARKNLTWIVDDDGFGQYGMVFEDGRVWVPSPRPSFWSE